MQLKQTFSGSYQEGDVVFLLKLIEMEMMDVTAKERAIQTGAAHYSEMLSAESSPGPEYLSLFHRALETSGPKFAAHVASLAATLAARPGREVVVVSLARAGTPVGVLLHRALKHLGRASAHYSVSIIRDRGIDWIALDYVLGAACHADSDIVFIDGWTGKGVISAELRASVSAYNAARGVSLSPDLVVVADLAGSASLAATSDDYLIPNAVLNSTVSGLVSRTVLNRLYVGENDFHGCLFYAEKREEDLSRHYVDVLTPLMLDALDGAPLCSWSDETRSTLKSTSDGFIDLMKRRYATDERNHIKPGIGESTRALLRRVPDRLILKDSTADDVQHLIRLADEKSVVIEVDRQMPYRAAVVIKSVGE